MPVTVTIETVISASVTVVLLACSGILVLAARRRGTSLLLAGFLGLVGLNFGAGVLSRALFAPAWDVVAAAALALDPVFLLAFVASFPWVRAGRALRMVRAVVAVAALAVLIVLALLPAEVASRAAADAPFQHPARALQILELAVAYSAAWFVAARGVAVAPTPGLAARARWVAVGVAVAVLPRLSLLPLDLRVLPSARETLLPLAVLGAAIALPVAAVGWALARGADATGRRAVALALAAAISIEALNLALQMARSWTWFWGAVFPLRWLVFAGVLGAAVLRDEGLEMDRGAEGVAGFAGAFLGGLGVFLGASLVLLGAGDHAPTELALPAALGAATAVPSGLAAHALARRAADASGLRAAAGRRLELYRAALEEAWSRGEPDEVTRRRLARDRRTFRVTWEEARALEHVVAGGWRARASLRPGDEPIPGIVLEGALGEGAHGRAFAARRHTDGRRVVVKEFPAADSASRRRFLREVNSLRRLDHPNIVRLLDFAIRDGGYLLVLDRVDGEGLDRRLAAGPLGEVACAQVLRGVLAALAASHAAGILHRDVKPSNVLLAGDRVVLTDFSLADVAPPTHSATLATFEAPRPVAGTIAYMAPEQASGAPPAPASDLFAAGLVAYEMLTGRPALDVRGLSAADALRRAQEARVDLERAPAAWRAFLARALEPDPGERFSSAEAMAAAVP